MKRSERRKITEYALNIGNNWAWLLLLTPSCPLIQHIKLLVGSSYTEPRKHSNFTPRLDFPQLNHWSHCFCQKGKKNEESSRKRAVIIHNPNNLSAATSFGSVILAFLKISCIHLHINVACCMWRGLRFPVWCLPQWCGPVGRQGQLRHKDWFCSPFAVEHFNTFSVIASCQWCCDGKQTPLRGVCMQVCVCVLFHETLCVVPKSPPKNECTKTP